MQGVDVEGFGGERGLIVALRVGQAAVTMGRETAGKYGVHDGKILQTLHFPILALAFFRFDLDLLPRWYITCEHLFILLVDSHDIVLAVRAAVRHRGDFR